MGFVEIFLIGVGLSMDAFAVSVCKGLGMHRVNYVHALVIALIIGCTTFVLSLVGVVVGNRFGARFEKPSQIAGGVVLIAIGLKILLEHLGLIAF